LKQILLHGGDRHDVGQRGGVRRVLLKPFLKIYINNYSFKVFITFLPALD
jgi:hypothetical protein